MPPRIAGEPLDGAGKIHFVRTADGWNLALRRHCGGEDLLPVILCPGYGCSGRFLDYDDRYSLARYLAREGLDAWVLDLRGRGASHPEDRAPQRWRWTFDDFVRQDLPAAVDRVRQVTGRTRIAWIGHSMGGVAMYAFLGTAPLGRDAVAALVTIASPVLFPSLSREILRRMGRAFLRLPPPTRTVPQRLLVGLFWNALGFTNLLRIGMNPGNLDRRLAQRVLDGSLHNVSWAKLRQLGVWAAEQVFCSVDFSIDYRAELARVNVPLLAAAGAGDQLADPRKVRLAVDEVSSTDRSFLEFGERAGYSTDYGHIDLIFGRSAPEEVFPTIRDWLVPRLRV